MKPSLSVSRPAKMSGASPATKQSLTPPQRRTLELFQRIRYGVVFRLSFRDGQPVLGPEVRWKRKVKVLGANEPHPALGLDDFVLRQEVTRFFRQLADLGAGVITNLEICNGLPVSFEIEEAYGG